MLCIWRSVDRIFFGLVYVVTSISSPLLWLSINQTFYLNFDHANLHFSGYENSYIFNLHRSHFWWHFSIDSFREFQTVVRCQILRSLICKNWLNNSFDSSKAFFDFNGHYITLYDSILWQRYLYSWKAI